MIIHHGETKRVECSSCLTEFDITYEPKAKGYDRKDVSPGDISYCPSCGSDLESTDDDDDS